GGIVDAVSVGIRPDLIEQVVEPALERHVRATGGGSGAVAATARTGAEVMHGIGWDRVPARHRNSTRIRTGDRFERVPHALERELPGQLIRQRRADDVT